MSRRTPSESLLEDAKGVEVEVLLRIGPVRAIPSTPPLLAGGGTGRGTGWRGFKLHGGRVAGWRRVARRRVDTLYGRRMQIEESFRDTKSVRWGFRFRHVRLSSCERYERLMMVLVLAYLFLMAVGAQAERDGQHRRLMANTVRSRTLRWFTVGRACIRDSLATCVRFLRPALVQL